MEKPKIPAFVTMEFAEKFLEAVRKGVGFDLKISATDQSKYPVQLMITLGTLHAAVRLSPKADTDSEGNKRPMAEIVQIYAPVLIDEIRKRIDETHLLHVK